MPLETYSQDIVDTVRDPLLMLDTTLSVHSANRAFYQTSQVSAEETEHHLIYELGNGQWDIPDLRRLSFQSNLISKPRRAQKWTTRHSRFLAAVCWSLTTIRHSATL